MDTKNSQVAARIDFYPAAEKKTDATAVILPGGGYSHLADHEGRGYAEMLNSFGMSAFVCRYSLAPAHFPAQLLDSRRAMRFVRANAEEFGIDPHRVAIMGSSAGGHLAALTSTFTDKLEGEGAEATDGLPFLPDAQILCYPVLLAPSTGFAHEGSYNNLLGEKSDYSPDAVSPVGLVSASTPAAFIWHTANDGGVNVINSYEYAKALRLHDVPVELHVFPDGPHGLGTAPALPHVAQWTGLLKNWLDDLGWLK